jgi:hypothetical protein
MIFNFISVVDLQLLIHVQPLCVMVTNFQNSVPGPDYYKYFNNLFSTISDFIGVK